MKAFIRSQFRHFPLAWTFHSKILSKEINTLHDRTLRITYGDIICSFNELLEENSSVSTHPKNL